MFAGSEKKRKFLAIYVYLFLIFVSLNFLTASWPVFYSPDVSESRVEVARSIVERGDLSVPQGIGIRVSDRRAFSTFPPGSVLMALPFYLTAKLSGIPPENAISLMNPIVGAGTAALVFLFSASLGYSNRSSVAVSFFYGLGTMAWYYAKDPGDHVIETFFILLAFYCMNRYAATSKISRLILSAFSFGVAFMARPTSIMVVPSLLYLMIRHDIKGPVIKAAVRSIVKNSGVFLLGTLPFAFLFMWYNYYRFGSIFETGYTLTIARYGVDYFTGTSILTGLKGFIASPGKGFFYYSPVALLFFFSIRSFSKKHHEMALSLIATIAGYLLFFSRLMFWDGDFAWGPRYLFALTPLFIIPIASLLDSLQGEQKKFRKYAIYVVFIISFLVQSAAVSVHPYKYFYYMHDAEKLKFIEMRSDGLLPIVHPPREIYFEWQRSPLLAQFRFLGQITRNMKNFGSGDPLVIGKIKAAPWMNVFDFWWIYKYCLEKSYTGFIVVAYLLAAASYSGFRLWRAIRC